MVAETEIRPQSRTGTTGGLDEKRAYQELPQNLEAEQGLLGCLLIDNKALERVSDFLRPYHFYVPAHQRIYAAILKLVERGQSAGPVTLKNHFAADAELEHVGGAEYLADLAASIITVINAEDYGRTIHDLYMRRELIALCQGVMYDAYDARLEHERGAADIIEQAEGRLFRLAETGEAGGGVSTLYDAMRKALISAELAFNHDGGVTGVTTGLVSLDRRLGGMQPSDLIILAGRPSMGKTALATTIGINAARCYAQSGGKEGAPVGFFSLEMSDEQLGQRVLAEQSEISSDLMRKGQVRAGDFHRFTEITQQHTEVPFYIEPTSNLSIDAVRTRARRLKRQYGIGLLIVDYLQLLRAVDTYQARQNRTIEVSEITRGLKSIAKDLNIPVLALSQLSREVEKREDKRPQLSDLRESGSIEQDADVVCFLYREEYYLSRDEPKQKGEERDEAFRERYANWGGRMGAVANTAEVMIAKQRMGPIGVEKLSFNPELTRFTDL
jgi:replicative DNA helicase